MSRKYTDFTYTEAFQIYLKRENLYNGIIDGDWKSISIAAWQGFCFKTNGMIKHVTKKLDFLLLPQTVSLEIHKLALEIIKIETELNKLAKEEKTKEELIPFIDTIIKLLGLKNITLSTGSLFILVNGNSYNLNLPAEILLQLEDHFKLTISDTLPVTTSKDINLNLKEENPSKDNKSKDDNKEKVKEEKNLITKSVTKLKEKFTKSSTKPNLKKSSVTKSKTKAKKKK